MNHWQTLVNTVMNLRGISWVAEWLLAFQTTLLSLRAAGIGCYTSSSSRPSFLSASLDAGQCIMWYICHCCTPYHNTAAHYQHGKILWQRWTRQLRLTTVRLRSELFSGTTSRFAANKQMLDNCSPMSLCSSRFIFVWSILIIYCRYVVGC
jgi:hypothetical protein